MNADRLDYAGKFLKDYEGRRYTFLERNLRWLDDVRSILVPSDAEDFADISFYQAGMNWDKYASLARAVILRIGQNVWKDTEFESNYAAAKRRGLAVGGYFFFDGRATPQQQASVIIAAMNGKTLEVELFVDWEREYGGASEGLPNVVKLMQLIEAAGVKCKAVGLYTGFYFFTGHSNASTNAAQYTYLKQRPLWLAWYAAASMVRTPAPWTDWMHWQYGTPVIDMGQPTMEIDKNKHNGTRAQFAQRYLGAVTIPPNGGTMPYKKATGNMSIRTGAGTTFPKVTINGIEQYVLKDDIIEVGAALNGFVEIKKLYRNNALVALPAVAWCGTLYLVDTTYTPPDTEPPVDKLQDFFIDVNLPNRTVRYQRRMESGEIKNVDDVF